MESKSEVPVKYTCRDLFNERLYSESKNVSIYMMVSDTVVDEKRRLALFHLRKFNRNRATKEGISLNYDQTAFLLDILPKMANFQKDGGIWSQGSVRVFVEEDPKGNSLIRFRKEKNNVQVQQLTFKLDYVPLVLDFLDEVLDIMKRNSEHDVFGD